MLQGFFFKKTTRLIFSLVLFSIFLYSLLYWSTGDPALGLLRKLGVQSITQEALAETRERLGIDGNLFSQYFRWAGKVLQGNFGNSFSTGQPVMEEISKKLAVTLVLIGVSFSILVPVSLSLGLALGNSRKQSIRESLQQLLMVLLSVPNYWLSIVFIFIFGVQLHWLPFVGSQTISNFVLPVAVIVIIEGSYLTKLTSDLVEKLMQEDRFVLARYRGIKERYLLLYQIKILFTPLLTLYVNCLTHLLGSTIIVEIIFSISGLGSLFMSSITARDYPMIQGISLLIAFVTFAFNYLVDLLIQLADPRIQLQERSKSNAS